MHQIDGVGATAQNLFTEGDASQAIPATQVTADWLNSVQEELVAIAEHNGGELDKANNGQVLAKILEIASENKLGVGQTWQDLTASRAVNVTYTNTTGRPIVVSVIIEDAVGNQVGAYLNVDGYDVARSASEATDVVAYQTVSAIVPDGSTYRVTFQTSDDLNYWWELRS